MKTAAEILAWCVNNSNKNDFAIMADFAGHVDMLSVYIHVGGYKKSNSIRLGHAFSYNQESLDSLFSRLETLKYYNDQSSQWAKELADNKKQSEIAKLKLQLSELEG